MSKEKGIETQIVLDAVKDALLVAARKYYRTNENYIAELNEKTGSIDLFAVKKVVETVENPRYDPQPLRPSVPVRSARPTLRLRRPAWITPKGDDARRSSERARTS